MRIEINTGVRRWNFLVDSVMRRGLGVPNTWATVKEWIDDSRAVAHSESSTVGNLEFKNPEVPVLKTYDGKAKGKFWEIFPKFFPKKPSRSVREKRLRWYVQKCWFLWTRGQKRVALKALKRVAGKEKVVFKSELTEVRVKNARSAHENGAHMTDAICSWVKKKFVAGPYKKPPFKAFRANPLMAVVQKTKVRPIMNLSSPKGQSFNDAVDEFELEKLKMSSPRIFAETIAKCGEGAVIAKSDIKDAYK